MTHLKRVKMVKILLIGYGAMNQRVARLAEKKDMKSLGSLKIHRKQQRHINNTNILLMLKMPMLQ